jgi:serine/threonine-protein kinase
MSDDPGRRRDPRLKREIVEEQTVTRRVDAPPLDRDDDVRLISQDERITVDPDGAVRRDVDRIERTPRRTPLWPALLVLLALVAAGLAALWYFTRDEQTAVPAIEGLALDEAINRLQDDGFKADVTSRASEEPEGIVINQRPAAGTDADEGSTVLVVSSKGPATVRVPNAVGVSEAEARDRLAEAGLPVSVILVFSEAAEGQVTDQDPPAGEQVPEDTTVRLDVSKGTGEVDVPSVVGLPRDEAVSTVEAAGLRTNVVTVPSAEPVGTVVAQNPTGGVAREGSAVRLNVSSGAG